jgi:CRISPR/Cas system-associated protein Csm6
MDDERCCPEGSAEQEQTNMFIKEVQMDPEKASQGNNKEHHSAENGKTTGCRDTHHIKFLELDKEE